MKNVNCFKKFGILIVTVGTVMCLAPLEGNARETTEEKWDKYDSIQISPEFLTGGFSNDEYWLTPSEGNHLIFKDEFLNITRFSGEGYSDHPASIDGFSVLKNLENMEFEGGQVSDFRPVRSLKKVKEFYMSGSNNNTLVDFENWNAIERFGYYDTGSPIKRIALTDLSALSNKPNLETIDVSVVGNLPTVTLSQRNRNYELFDPIILADLFKGKVEYSNVDVQYKEDVEDDGGEMAEFTPSVSEDGLIRWEGIPTNAAELTFTAKIYEGQNHYYGEISIPIRWVK